MFGPTREAFRFLSLIAIGVMGTGSATTVLAKAKAPARVVIDGLAFAPKAISVSVGQEIRWINQDLVPHTVTAAGAFDSKTIPPNGSWAMTPKKKGHLDYKCLFHPTMSGSIDVR